MNKLNNDFFYEYAKEIYCSVDAELAAAFLADAHSNFNFEFKYINLYDVDFEYFDNIVVDVFSDSVIECYLTDKALKEFYFMIIDEISCELSCNIELVNNQFVLMSVDDFYNVNDYYNLDSNSLDDLLSQFDFIFSDYNCIHDKIYNFILDNSYKVDADADAVEVI